MSDDVLSEYDQWRAKLNGRLDEIAKMSSLEYGRKRKELAEELGLTSIKFLDAEVKRLQRASGSESTRNVVQAHWQVEPWPDPVRGEELINDIVSRLESHVATTKEVLLTTALWVVFAWTHDAAVHSPMLLVTSPEPECGKSTLLGIVKYLARNGLIIIGSSAPVIYRLVEAWHPTLIVDEADDVFKDSPDIRFVINSGWTRGAGVPRCHPDTHEPEIFETFGPKAIGIKGLKVPAPTLGRSIVVEMYRKLPDERVTSFLHQDDEGLSELRQKLARFAADEMDNLIAAVPRMPEGFNNRLEANWKPLLAIAEICKKGEEARAAAKALSHRTDEISVRIELLRDMVGIIQKRGVEWMHGDDIVTALVAMENRPWAEWGYRNPKPISKNQVAGLLKPFHIQPAQKKIGGLNRNGYSLDMLSPVLTRYQGSTALHPFVDKGLRENQSSTDETEVERQNPRNHLRSKGCRAVEVQNTPLRGNGNGAGVCVHCGDPGEEGNPVMPTVVSDDGERLPLHEYCRAEWFNQTRGE